MAYALRNNPISDFIFGGRDTPEPAPFDFSRQAGTRELVTQLPQDASIPITHTPNIPQIPQSAVSQITQPPTFNQEINITGITSEEIPAAVASETQSTLEYSQALSAQR